MGKSAEPVVLELASLPREQMGPFLILGLDKAASQKAVEEHWADRVKWARRNLIKVPLEDINWAREMLRDPERRIKADAGSLNSDTGEGILSELEQRYGLQGGQTTRMWQPLDREKMLEEYNPAVEIPDWRQVHEGIQVEAVPDEIPTVGALLRQLAEQKLDPWGVELPEG